MPPKVLFKPADKYYMKNKEMTQKQIDQATDLKLFEAFRLVEKNNLLYFRIMKKMNFLVTPNFPAIGGVGYNKEKNQIYMILKEDAMLNGSKEDVAGLTEHECGHCLYEHIFEPDQSVDHSLMNVAQDLLINDSAHYITSRIDQILAKDSKSILAGGCFFSEFQKKYPSLQKYTSEELTSTQLYALLREAKKDEPQQNQSQQGQGQGKKGKGQSGQGQQMNNGEGGFDSHDSYEIVEDAEGNEVAQKMDQQNQSAIDKQKQEMSAKMKEIVGEAIEQLKREGQLEKAIGQLSGRMKVMVQDLIKSRTDKNSIFNFLTRLSIGVKKKWTKLHRRYPYLAKGKRKNKKAKIALVIDTSGSMGMDELFELIKDQVQVLVNRCEQLWIVVGDTQMEYSVFVKNKRSFNIDDVVFQGRGGTDLQFGWDFAKEKNLDGVIVHTDGHIGEFDDHGIPSIFYLYGRGNQEQEGYQNIQVYPL